MYRLYIKKNEIEIRVNEEKLEYEMPPLLNAPFFYEVGKVKNNKKIKWIKDINFKYGKSKSVSGYAGIFDEGRLSFAKTIVFCDDIDHAERMRKELVNLNKEMKIRILKNIHIKDHLQVKYQFFFLIIHKYPM